jgi:hypothetical protein
MAMELSSSKLYHGFFSDPDFTPAKMGFACEPVYIVEFESRFRLAKSFEGLQLKDYTEHTTAGYNAFVLLFLTHSVLERYFKINNIKIGDLDLLLEPYNPQQIASEFTNWDKDRKLYVFIYARLKNKDLQKKFALVYDGKSNNVAYLSAAIRHIFVHGHLTANVNRINPKHLYRESVRLSDFLLAFMDAEFTKKVKEYESKLKRD